VIFARDLSTPEAPVLLKDRSWLVVEMGLERGCVTHISADGRGKRMLAKTGRPNGLALDRDGVIWVAESLNPPSLIRLTMDGKAEVAVTECDGESFLFPNDLAFGPDGAIYMTDSGIALAKLAPGGELNPDFMNLKYDGRVYRIDPKTKKGTKLDSGFQFTNGIAFDSDKNLYVNETMTGMVYRYQWKAGKVVTKREEFGNVVAPGGAPGLKGPDGMKCGANGNLYVAVFGQGDITVLGPDGTVVKRLKTGGMLPSNLAFGPPGEKRIYVTEDETGTLEVIDVDCDGLPLYT